ncbi:MAG TPA: hemolysin family protein [Ktedonobacterales bacterium]|nr:hemolysin family protein [Ktedonobacterales bacterium]
MESDSTGLSGLFTLAAAGSRGFQTHDWVLLFFLFLTLVVAAISAGAETALTSVSRLRIRNLAEEGDAKAKRVAKLLQKPQSFLTTILVVSNVAVITGSTLATIIAVDLDFSGAEVISTALLSLIVLIFCEITPKSIAVLSPVRWARWLVRPLEAIMFVLQPLVIALTWVTSGMVRLFGGRGSHYSTQFVTEDELRLLVEVGEEEGVLEEEEREMIDNVFDLSDTAVREIMVPRIDMVTVEADDDIRAATQVILQGGQSRIPVYEDSIDNIIGVLYAKDLLRIYAMDQQATIREMVRPPFFVPESKRLDDLLREMQSQRVHIAIVVDEYGSVAGLVTIEDLVEEIIGDIQDEYDVEEQLFEKLGENDFILDAKVSLDEFEELVERELPEDGYETVGGFVISQLDKIPSVNDTTRYEDMAFTVLGTKGRRITKLRVERGLPPAQADNGASETPSGGDTPLALPAAQDSSANIPAPPSHPRQ